MQPDIQPSSPPQRGWKPGASPDPQRGRGTGGGRGRSSPLLRAPPTERQQAAQALRAEKGRGRSLWKRPLGRVPPARWSRAARTPEGCGRGDPPPHGLRRGTGKAEQGQPTGRPAQRTPARSAPGAASATERRSRAHRPSAGGGGLPQGRTAAGAPRRSGRAQGQGPRRGRTRSAQRAARLGPQARIPLYVPDRSEGTSAPAMTGGRCPSGSRARGSEPLRGGGISRPALAMLP